jgi:hypothetical protein
MIRRDFLAGSLLAAASGTAGAAEPKKRAPEWYELRRYQLHTGQTKVLGDYLGEAVEPWSFLKSTYWKVLGYPEGVYRVGPLARVIVAAQMGTPRADMELDLTAVDQRKEVAADEHRQNPAER